MAASPSPPPPSTTHQQMGNIARAASILAIGNVASRLLGLLREMVKAQLFGAGAQVDALTLALKIPLLIYELTIGGLVNSALVPVFSDYTAPERRAELWQLVNNLLTLAAAGLSGLVLLAELFTPLLARMVGSGLVDLALAIGLLRITLPGVLFLSLSGIISALLYSLKRFAWPAFIGATFNATLVICALLFSARLGVASMAIGLLLGSILQIAIQLPGLRDARLRLQFRQHDGLGRIFKLYVPIIFGLVVTQASIYVGLNLASNTGEGGIAWMDYATYLYQFPLGLVSTALSFAILPTLARQALDDSPLGLHAFRDTLVQGLNMVVVLIVPATVGLFVMAGPIIRLLLEWGEFTAYDTAQTAQVLRVFLLGLSFAAVDQMLIFAFYARKNTLTPSLVGVASVVIYVTAALLLIDRLGLLSLMVADALKQTSHALITGYLMSRLLGGFRQTALGSTVAKTLLAAAVMGVAAWGLLWGMERLVLPDGLLIRVIVAGVPSVGGALVYLGLVAAMRVPELEVLRRAVLHRLSG